MVFIHILENGKMTKNTPTGTFYGFFIFLNYFKKCHFFQNFHFEIIICENFHYCFWKFSFLFLKIFISLFHNCHFFYKFLFYCFKKLHYDIFSINTIVKNFHGVSKHFFLIFYYFNQCIFSKFSIIIISR